MEYRMPTPYTHGALYGTYVKIDGEPTEDELSQAKSELVDTLCSMIREIAKENDDFFIIKKTLDGDATTVGVKIAVPSIEIKKLENNYGR